MPPENVRRRKKEKRYSVVFVPSDETAKPRTYSLSRWGIVGASSAICVLFIAVILAIVMYTPAGRLLPIAHPELEYVYGRQLVQIQEQLNSLLQEMVTLRAYNVRLRTAMGEKVSTEDSAFVALQTRDTISNASLPMPHQMPVGTDADQRGSFDRNSLRSLNAGEAETGQAAALVAMPSQHKVSEIDNDLPFGSPVRGYFTRGFDTENAHLGIDFAGKEGSPVFAAAGGRVLFANWTYEDGFQIILAHDRGYTTVYKHNQLLMKQVGDEVKRGDVIALLGNTGRTSSGPHLHFEVWKDGAVQNPMKYLINIQ